MSLQLAYEIYYIELFHIFSIILFVAVNYWIYLNSKKSPLLYYYLAVQLMILIWLLSKVFKTVSPNETVRWFFIVTQYFGNCFLGSTFLLFSYVYTFGKGMKTKYAVLLNILPAFFFMAMLTNPFHMLFYSYYDFYRDSFGPLFYVHQAYSYLNILIGFILCAKNFQHQYAAKKMQSLLLSIAIIIPLAVNVLYILKLFKPLFGFRPLFDITPIACNLSLMLFALAIFKYEFLDILPNARNTVLDQLPESAVILDTKSRIIGFNNAFTVLGATLKRLSDQDRSTLPVWLLPLTTSDIHKNLKLTLPPLHNQDMQTFDFETETNHYKIYYQAITSGEKTIGSALLFIDISTHAKIIRELKEKKIDLLKANDKLEERSALIRDLIVTKIRNHMAKEVHDVLGHSLVLAITMLEVATLSLETQPMYAKKVMEETTGILEESMFEIAASFQENAGVTAALDHKKADKLHSAIGRMAQKFTHIGVVVDIQFQGTAFELTEDEAASLYRVIQEGITNAVRHGQATEITIIFRYTGEGYEFFILDNGLGCDIIHKGYGLLGMEERIHSNKGTITFGSSEHSGFCIHAAIPRSNAIAK